MDSRTSNLSGEDAEAVALRALAFLAEDRGRMARFFDLTGVDPARIATVARDPSFLTGVVDHVLADETLLLTFCANGRLDPHQVAAARRALRDSATGRRRTQRGNDR